MDKIIEMNSETLENENSMIRIGDKLIITVPEPELSVETLLDATREAEEEELEDIGFQEKSETRILIEKFVDENPEATAALLRNWLNDDWE